MTCCALSTPPSFFAGYVAPLASPLIAFLVVVIAYQQWRIAREKLRLDLYERRFDVYSRTIDFAQALMEWGERDPGERVEVQRLFIKAALESEFLFASDPSIADLLHEIHINAFIVKGFVEYIAPQAGGMGELFDAEFKKKEDALESIRQSTSPLQRKLSPFLAFGQKQSNLSTRKRFNLGGED